MKIMVILLVISIICLIVSLYLFIKSCIEIRRNKTDIPDWDNMSIQEIIVKTYANYITFHQKNSKGMFFQTQKRTPLNGVKGVILYVNRIHTSLR